MASLGPTGYFRRKTRLQAQEQIGYHQTRFEGGENSDAPASEIAQNQCALLENMVGYEGFVEGRAGTVNYTAEGVVPGEGEIYSYTQNLHTGQWLLHRGAHIWLSTDDTQSEWNEVYPAANQEAAQVSPSDQFQIYLRGLSRDNTLFDSGSATGKLYYSLVGGAGIVTLSLYKDAGRSQLVAEGTTLSESLVVLNPTVNGDAGVPFSVDYVYGATPDNTDAGDLYWTMTISSDPDVATFVFYSRIDRSIEVSRVVVPIKFHLPVVSDPFNSMFTNMVLSGWDASTLFAKVTNNPLWNSQFSGPSVTLRSVWFADANNGWAVDDGGNILFSTDGGASWGTQAGGYAALRGVFFISATVGWVVGDLNGSSHGTILHTTDGGTNWTPQTNTDGHTLNAVSFFDSTHGIACGQGGAVLYTSNGGTTWTAGSSGTSEELLGASMMSASLAVVVGTLGKTQYSSDGGATFGSGDGAGSIKDLYSVWFLSSTVGFAVGDAGVILKSIDSGASWVAVSGSPINRYRSVYFSDINNGYIVGDSGVVVQTQDGGRTWSFNLSVTTEILRSVNHGIAVGNDGIIIVSVPPSRSLSLYASSTDRAADAAAVGAATWLIADEPATTVAITGSLGGSFDVAILDAQTFPINFTITSTSVLVGKAVTEPTGNGPALGLDIGDLSSAISIDDPSDVVSGVVATHPDYIILSLRNSSGLGAYAPLEFSGNEDGEIDDIPINVSLEDAKSRSKEWQSSFILMTDRYNIYVNQSINRFYPIWFSGAPFNSFFQSAPAGSGSNTTDTPYGRRYILTLSRIENSDGTPSYDGNRITKILKFESAGTLADATGVDYCEIWTSDAPGSIPTATPRILIFRHGSDPDWVFLNGYYTHVSIYATQDIGVNGINPTTGLAHNSEIYVWLDDVDITKGFYQDIVSDDTLGARLGLSAYLLASRGYESMTSSLVMGFTPEILYVAPSTTPMNIRYEFLSESKLYGFHFPTQFHASVFPVADIFPCGSDYFACMGKSGTWISNPRAVQSVLGVYEIVQFEKRDDSIGIKEWNALVRVDDGNFIAICGDGTVRVFDGNKWGDDLAYNMVGKTIRRMIVSPLLAYISGAVFIFYRTDSDSDFNNNCERYGFGGSNGFRWSRLIAGVYDNRFSKIPLYGGVSRGVSSDGTLRLFAINPVTNRVYQMEQFPEGGVWRDGMDKEPAFVNLTGNGVAYFETPVISGWDKFPLFLRVVRSESLLIFVYASDADRFSGSDPVMSNAVPLDYDTPYPTLAFVQENDSGLSMVIDFGGVSFGDGSPLDVDMAYVPSGFSGGEAIACRLKTREAMGTSERYRIEHQASWYYVRPSDSDYEDGIEFTSKVYVDGSATPSGAMTGVPKDGQVGYYDPVIGKRIQSELISTMSGFRVTGIDGLMKSFDVAPVGQRMGTQQDSQKALSNGLASWAACRYGVKDRVGKGVYVTAGDVTLVLGPSGRTDALLLAQDALLAETSQYSGDFTLFFWTTGSQPAGISMGGASALSISFYSNALMTVVGTSFSIRSCAATWSMFVVRRDGGFITVLQDGVVMASIASTDTFGGASLTLGAGKIFDRRIKADLINDEALEYYRADVLAGGVKCLPI